jgi:hypothetical protein
MKLRVKGNSLRYRLTKTDVSNLASNGNVKEVIEFGNTTLAYVLQSTPKDALHADFKENTLTIYIPQKNVAELASTNRVGFSGNTGKLSLLIEKDFTCLDDVAEDQSDNYPNPLLDNK